MDDEFDEEELRQEFQMSHNNQANKRHQHPQLNLDDEDDEELEKQLMQQLQNQPEILQKKR